MLDSHEEWSMLASIKFLSQDVQRHLAWNAVSGSCCRMSHQDSDWAPTGLPNSRKTKVINGTMLLLFPHPNVKSPFEDATQTWMGHFQFLARTSALPLWIWQLELGMLSIWRTASCFTTGWRMNWLKWPTSGLEINKRKCSGIRRRCTQAVGHEHTSETRKTAMQQLESYTHKQASTVSRHGLRFPGRTTNDGGEAHVSANWPQFVHASSLKKGKAFISSSCCPLLRCLHQWPPTPYPSQPVATPPVNTCQDQIGVLVCTTGTNAWSSKLAWFSCFTCVEEPYTSLTEFARNQFRC